MSQFAAWAGRLQEELARELGQPLTLSPASEGPEPEGSVCDVLTAPGVRILLMADAEGVAGFLVEARVIEAGQTDQETVRELWSGILASVAAGMGGQAAPGKAPEGVIEPWVLRLGQASVRVALAGELEKEPASPPVTPAAKPPASAPAARSSQRATGNFDLLLEVELDAAVRFGSREMELKDLLELGPGDVVELDRLVADPVDLIVGDRIVARGEVVLVNGNFGLRVTEVAEPVRRLESIRCLW